MPPVSMGRMLFQWTENMLPQSHNMATFNLGDLEYTLDECTGWAKMIGDGCMVVQFFHT